MFSFGIEPSITSTNGASSSPRAAWRNGARNSSPPSVGDRTLLWRLTFGMPGIAPSRTSSMPGWPAAVTDTESPSQLMPSEIQRMWTSSTPAAGSLIRDRLLLLDVQRLDSQLLARGHLDVPRAAGAAGEREGGELAAGAAAAAAPGGGHLGQRQLGALGDGALRDQLEREGQRRRDDLAQVADRDLDAGHATAPGMALDHGHDRLGERQLMHQQILGSGSPTSWSITRRPPKAVSTSTIPGGSVRTSPMSAARSHPGTARSAASAASARSGATKATSLPSLATYIGSMPRISAAPATIGSTGISPSRTTIATPDARASSLSTDATPPRVASRMQRSPGPATSSRASATGHSERVSDSTSASSSNSPRASMIAVPCSPIEPESRMRSPGRSDWGARRARGSGSPRPVVARYIPSAWPRSTTLVSPATTSTPAAAAACAIASTSARSTPASRPSSRIIAIVRASGRAPATARSLTVPLTASSPIEPPGKRSGLTTNESVVMTMPPAAPASAIVSSTAPP